MHHHQDLLQVRRQSTQKGLLLLVIEEMTAGKLSYQTHGSCFVLPVLDSLGRRFRIVSSNVDAEPMDAAVRERLESAFGGDIEALEQTLERDLSAWKSGSGDQ